MPYDHPSACVVRLFYLHCLVLRILIYQSFSLNLGNIVEENKRTEKNFTNTKNPDLEGS